MSSMNRERIDKERYRLDIQLHTNEIVEIADTIHPPAKFLIFGLGNDSKFWCEINREGRTVFIEDSPMWFDLITNKQPELEVYLVDYQTKRSDWREYANENSNLYLKLPDSVLQEKWDIILIDGPAGYSDNTPGRMKSIFLAAKLATPGADVFLHDAQREVEQQFSRKYLKDENLISVIQGRATLNHYKIK